MSSIHYRDMLCPLCQAITQHRQWCVDSWQCMVCWDNETLAERYREEFHIYKKSLAEDGFQRRITRRLTITD